MVCISNFLIFTAQRYANAVCATVLCSIVCLSLASRHRTEIAKHITTQTTKHNIAQDGWQTLRSNALRRQDISILWLGHFGHRAWTLRT